MNRAERRAGRWDELNPHADYDTLVKETGDGAKVIIVLLRHMMGDSSISKSFTDRQLWTAVKELIDAGFLRIFFRFGKDGVEIRPEFLMPKGRAA